MLALNSILLKFEFNKKCMEDEEDLRFENLQHNK